MHKHTQFEIEVTVHVLRRDSTGSLIVPSSPECSICSGGLLSLKIRKDAWPQLDSEFLYVASVALTSILSVWSATGSLSKGDSL